MRPSQWHPPVELSSAEQVVVARIRRAKLFTFRRRIRHELFSDALQDELATLYKDSREGWPPVPPAQLALATILQASTGVSDDAVIEALVMDRRWQLVLDCRECQTAPFAKATLGRLRAALMRQGLDRRLLERPVALAEQAGGFGPRQVRAALDSSPLWGAGRVEDTFNLLGHALRKALGVLARQQGRELAAVAAEAGAGVVAQSSLKAAVDRDWDDSTAREEALATVLAALDAVDAWLAGLTDGPPAGVSACLDAARQVRAQDVVVDAAGTARLVQGVAVDRRISISVEDPPMRHGRKSRSARVDGYKRHVVRDLDSGLVRAGGIPAANVPEAEVTDALAADLASQPVTLGELHIDRAYLSSTWVRERPAGLVVYCKAWPVRSGPGYAKNVFCWAWEQGTIRCPGGVVLPFAPGTTVPFPRERCAAGALRAQCTSSATGRTVTIHLTRTSACWRNGGHANRRRPGGRTCGHASRSSIAWPIAATGRAGGRATWASARTCSTCDAWRSSITCISGLASRPKPTPKRPE
jgi:transposase-like protein DUF772